MGFDTTLVLQKSRVLELIREQWREIAIKQGFVCLINMAILGGHPFDALCKDCKQITMGYIMYYLAKIGKVNFQNKASNISSRLTPLLKF